MNHPFDRDIHVVSAQPGVYEAEISGNWLVNGIPNGGYTMALLAVAMERQAGMNATPIITANYVARSGPGPARISVERIAASKQFERFQAILSQDGRETIRAFGTFSTANDVCAVQRCEASPPALPPPGACAVFPAMPGYTIFDGLDVRLDPECAGWMTSGQLAERSELRGWVRFREEREFDAAALLLAADAFPPAVFASQGMVAWVPTIELSVNVRSLAASPWLRCILRTRFITCGMLEEDGQLWDETGELVAVSRQIAQYRPAG